MKNAAEFGIFMERPQLDWAGVVKRKNELIGKFVGGKGPYLEKMGVDLVMGEAKFKSPEEIQVGEEVFSANRFLIGTGSESVIPPIEGMEHGITSKELLFMEKLPESMVIIGGGIIGMEFAHILSSAGTRVTVLQRGDRVLNTEDVETSHAIQEISAKKGLDIRLKCDVNQIKLTEDGKKMVHATTPDGKLEIAADVVMAATGRKPAIDQLQLSAAGVEHTPKGILVNEYFQTSSERIYAAGDSIGGYMYTPIAAHQAKIAVRNALKGNREKADYRFMTRAIFTLPPIGSVGLTEQQAKEQEMEYAVGKLPYAHSGTAILLGETEGHFKVIVDKKTRKIIGAHFVGQDADELIHMMTVAMKGNLTVDDFIGIIPVHPTLAESLVEMVRAIDG